LRQLAVWKESEVNFVDFAFPSCVQQVGPCCTLCTRPLLVATRRKGRIYDATFLPQPYSLGIAVDKVVLTSGQHLQSRLKNFVNMQFLENKARRESSISTIIDPGSIIVHIEDSCVSAGPVARSAHWPPTHTRRRLITLPPQSGNTKYCRLCGRQSNQPA